jgi:hypothetical protein
MSRPAFTTCRRKGIARSRNTKDHYGQVEVIGTQQHRGRES